MNHITISSEHMLKLLDEIGRARALTEAESEIVEEIVMQDAQPFRWNTRLDLALLRAAEIPGGIARFSRRHGISYRSTSQHLYRLRRRRGRERARNIPER